MLQLLSIDRSFPYFSAKKLMAKRKKNTFVPFDPTIIAALTSENWEIEIQAAYQYLSRYIHDLELLEAGEKIDYSQRRLDLAPSYIQPGQYAPEQNTINQVVNLSSRDIPRGSIAYFKLSGAMRRQDGFSSRGILSLSKQVDQASQNPNIAAAIFEIDSGGGDAVAGNIMMNTLEEFNKPLHVWTHFMASAALKMALPADMVTASGKSVNVGSIGTMLTINKKIVEFIKEFEDDIYAKQATKKNHEFREYIKGNKEAFAEYLTEVNELFIEEVKKFRTVTGPEEKVNDVFAGAMFTAAEALELGLIDEIGTINQVIENIRIDISRGQAFQKRIKRGSTAGADNFHNQNSLTMNINQFWKGIFPILNQKLGLSFKEDTKPEEAITALQDAPSITDMKAEIIAELKGQLNQEEKPGQATDAPADTEEKSILDMLKEMSTKIDAQNATIEQLKTGKLKTEQENAKLKGQKIDQNDKGEHDKTGENDNPTEKFQTITNFNQSVTAPGTSKY